MKALSLTRAAVVAVALTLPAAPAMGQKNPNAGSNPTTETKHSGGYDERVQRDNERKMQNDMNRDKPKGDAKKP